MDTLTVSTKQEYFSRLLQKHAKERGEATAYVFLNHDESSSLTFSQLHRHAGSIAAHLLDQGLGGKAVLLCYPAGLEFIKAFFACMYAGVVAVPGVAPARRYGEKLQAIAANAGAAALLCQRGGRHGGGGWVPEGLDVIATDEIGQIGDFSAKLSFQSQFPFPQGQPAFLQYTSGSTRFPKGVAVSAANIKANQEMIQRAFRITPESKLVGWLPHYHDMGLVGNILVPFHNGIPLIFMSPESFVKNPWRWLRAISDYRADISGGPNFAFDLCVEKIRDKDKKKLDLSAWRLAFNGSEPVRQQTLKRFYRAFKSCGFKQQAFYPCYGMAEATLFISGGECNEKPSIVYLDKEELRNNRVRTVAADSDKAQALVGCGHVWMDESMLIVDPQSRRPCAPGAIGEIWVGGDHISAGYWHENAATGETFSATTACGRGLFMRTGDLGFILGEQLYITGRHKELLIFRGANYYPADIEFCVQSAHKALRPRACAVFTVEVGGREQLVVAQEIKRNHLRNTDTALLIRLIRQKLAEQDLVAYAIVLLKPTQIPMTSSGKIRRLACRQYFEENAWQQVATWQLDTDVDIEEPGVDNYGGRQPRAEPDATRDLLAMAQNLGQVRQFPAQVLDAFNRHGWFQLRGSGGENLASLLGLLEKLGSVDLSMAMLAGVHHAAGQVLLQYGEDIPQDVISDLASGRSLCAFALSESGGGSNPALMRTRAQKLPASNPGSMESGWLLNGEKSMVALAGQARHICVFAVSDEGFCAFWIDRQWAGVSVEPLHTLGMEALGLGRISFHQVRLPPCALLGKTGDGMAIAHQSLKRNRVGIAAMVCGCMKASLQKMSAYARGRSLGGSSLLDHDLTQWHLQECILAQMALDSMVSRCERHFADMPDEVAMMLKIMASEWLWQTVDRLLQLHGGYGYLEGSGIGKLFRDARAFRIIEGPNESLQAYVGARWQSGAMQSYFEQLLPNPLADRLRESADRLQCLHPQQACIRIAELCGHALAAGLLARDEAAEAPVVSWCQQRFIDLCDNSGGYRSADREFVSQWLAMDPDWPVKPETTPSTPIISAEFEAAEDLAAMEDKLIEMIGPWLRETAAFKGNLDATVPLVGYGLDSVMAIELNFFLEQNFSVRLPPQLLWDYPSIRELSKFLIEQGAPRDDAATVNQSLEANMAMAEKPHQAWSAEVPAVAAGTTPLAFSLFYFASTDSEQYGCHDQYRLFMDSARYADRHGFSALWVPERHFHRFGGLFPNPSVLGAALATQTSQIKLRAGSVVAPLHHPIRIAEEWSVVDNLSNGRVEIGFARGWNANDFLFAPQSYDNRTEVMYAHMREVQALWRGEKVCYNNPYGEAVEVGLYPTPVQKELPVWITCSGGVERFAQAGACGANVITALLFQNREELVEKIRCYRQARESHGFDPDSGKVCLMLHTHVGESDREVRERVKAPFSSYLRSSVDLWKNQSEKLANLSERDLDAAVEYAFERYYRQNAFFGPVDRLREDAIWYHDNGINELACLVDFGLSHEHCLNGLEPLSRLKDEVNRQLDLQDITKESSLPLICESSRCDLENALSVGQKALWFLHRLAPQSRQYDILFATFVSSALDLDRLESAIGGVARRHYPLNVVFAAASGQPVMQPSRAPCVQVEFIPSQGREEGALIGELQAGAFEPFDLEKDTLLQVRVYSLAPQRHLILFRAHHIVMDFWSFFLLIQQVEQQYDSPQYDSLAPEPNGRAVPDYRRFVQEQSLYLNGPESERDWNYWRQKLRGELPLCGLPVDKPRPAAQCFEGDAVHMVFPRTVNQQLRELASTQATTLYTLLLTAFTVLLHRYSGQEDILLGSPTAGRDLPFAQTIGYFANVIVIRSDCGGAPTFKQLLQRNNKTVREALLHQNFPFPQLVEKLKPKRDSSYSPVFQVMFDLMNPKAVDKMIRRGQRQSSLHFAPFHLPQQQGQFDMALEIFDEEDGLSAYLKYNTALFEKDTVLRMALNYQTLLSNLPRQLDAKITEIDILHEQEKALIGSVPLRHAAGFENLATWLAHRIGESAELIALRCGRTVLTYEELGREAGRIRALLFENGFKPGNAVGLYMRRGWRMVAAMVAIVTSGGAYVPLDILQPRPRIRYICATVRLGIVLTEQSLANALPPQVRPLAVDSAQADAARAGGRRHTGLKIKPEDLAYIIHTSGTTGVPKGVKITHGNLCGYFDAMFKHFPMQPGERWLWFHSVCFDFSVWEVWGCLLSGGTLVILLDQELKDTGLLYRRMKSHNVSVFNQTPGAFRQFLEVDMRAQQPLQSLKYLFFAGEPLLFSRMKGWFERHEKTNVVNLYGVTETTVMSTFHPLNAESVTEQRSIIGKPLDNSCVYVLDANGRHVPAGVAGEIYIGGHGVGAGYCENSELTAQRFISDPFRPGGRMYRSGDVGLRLGDGRLVFLGRNDDQVKINGYRIELADIEQNLLQLPGVTEAVAKAWKDGQGHGFLAAYVVGARTLNMRVLKQALVERLPAYMIPRHLQQLPALPLNQNGKVDRGQLQKPKSVFHSREVKSPPDNGALHTLKSIWCRILELEEVPSEADFFELGGDSITAVRLVLEVEKAFDASLSLQAFLRVPTVAGQYAAIKAITGSTAVDADTPTPPPHRGYRESIADSAKTLSLRYLLRVLVPSWRVSVEGLSSREDAIYALWHGHGWPLLPLVKQIKLSAMASPSRDGRMMSSVLEGLGVTVVFGSAAKQGAAGLHALLKAMATTGSAALAVDGSRGPVHRVQPGVFELARLSGKPVVPVCGVCDRGWHLPGWDQAVLPKPFSRVVVLAGEPLLVNSQDLDFDSLREALALRLKALEARAKTRLEDA